MEKDPKYIYLPLIPGNRRAFVIYPYIFWSKRLRGWENTALVKHEMYHWEEQKIWKENKLFGLTRWLLKFIAQWFWFNLIMRFPRNEHPMEKPAYEIEYLEKVLKINKT